MNSIEGLEEICAGNRFDPLSQSGQSQLMKHLEDYYIINKLIGGEPLTDE